jgi:hypothetical protein
MGAFLRRQAFGLGLVKITGIITAFHGANDGQNSLSSKAARQPAEQPDPQAQSIAGNVGSGLLQETRPPLRMALFDTRDSLENGGAFGVFLRLRKQAVERNAVHLNQVILPIPRNIGGRELVRACHKESLKSGVASLEGIHRQRLIWISLHTTYAAVKPMISQLQGAILNERRHAFGAVQRLTDRPHLD